MHRRGFTMMELLVVLAIISMVFGGGFVVLSSMDEEKALRTPFIELRSMAKKAWMRSLNEQRAWQIRFLPDRFVLEPKQAVNADDQKMFQDADAAAKRGVGIETIIVDPEIVMEVRRWGEPQWFRPLSEEVTAWVVEHSGRCEPMSVRFSSERGTIGAQFDPLTAGVKEEINDRE